MPWLSIVGIAPGTEQCADFFVDAGCVFHKGDSYQVLFMVLALRRETELAWLVRHLESQNVALLDGVTIPVPYYGEGLHLPAETKPHTHRTPSVASCVASLE